MRGAGKRQGESESGRGQGKSAMGWRKGDLIKRKAHGGTDSAGPRMRIPPPPPPHPTLAHRSPPQGASGQQLVAKVARLKIPWAPKAFDAPRAQKAPEGKICPLCTRTLSPNPTLTLTPLLHTFSSSTFLRCV